MFEPARDRQLTSLTFKAKFLANLLWINPFIRRVNPYLKYINLQLAFSRYQAAVYIYSYGADKKLYKSTDKFFLNFGSGGFYHARWKNLDFPGSSKYYKYLQGKPGKNYVPIDLTLKKDLPFESNSASVIYCSHTIEHLPHEMVVYFLKECARVLDSNGRLRLAYPDFSYDVAKAKILHDQLGSYDYRFTAQARYAAHHMFHPSANSSTDYIVQSIISSEFNPAYFFELLKSMDTLKGEFRPSNPEYHLSFWSHEKLALLSRTSGFDIYLPELAGQSEAHMFRNNCIFDKSLLIK